MSSAEPVVITIDGDAASADDALSGADAAIASLQESFAALAAAAEEMSASIEAAFASIQASADDLAGSLSAASAGMDAAGGSADAAAGSIGGMAGATDAAAASVAAEGEAATAAAAENDALGDSFLVSADGARKMRTPLLLALAAVVAIGGVSVKMAGDFQESMTQLVTGAGESQANLQMVSNGVLDMSAQVGVSAKDLAAGLYNIESAGYHGSTGLTILRDAAEGAKVGGAQMADVANAATTILTDFGAHGVTAANAVNALTATVARGKTHLQDLAQALSQVAPTAAAAHVGLSDMMGALATMTGEGVPAANAATYLRQTILALDAPSAAAKKALAGIGLTTADVSDTMQKSLPAALAMITDRLAKKFPVGSAAYVAALKDIAGGSKQMQGMLDLTGDHLATFQQNVQGVAGTVKSGGSTIVGWSEVQKDFNQTMAEAGAAVQTAMIRIGTAIMPVIAGFANGLRPVLAWIADHGKFAAIVLGILAVVIGGALVGALIALTAAEWAAIAPLLPFIAIGAAIAAAIAGLVALVIYAYNHWGFFRDAVQGAGRAIGQLASDIGTRLQPILRNIGAAVGAFAALWRAHWSQISMVLNVVWNLIKGYVQVGWAIISGIIKVGLDILGGNWKGAWNDFLGIFKGIWSGIQTALGSSAQQIELTILRMVTGILQILSHVPGPIGDMASKGLAAVQKMEHGIETSMAKTKAATVEKTAAMKAESLIHFAEMQAHAAEHFDSMRRKLITEIANTSDPVKKRALEMKLGVVTRAEEMAKQTAKHAERMASETAAHGKAMADGMVTQAAHMHDDTLGRVRDMAGQLLARIGQIPGQAISAIWSLDEKLAGFFGSLAGKALSWGANIISGLISGIGSQIGNLTSKLGDVAGKIKSFLGFGSPTEEGPGSTADTWMPNLIGMLARDLTAGAGTLRAAATAAAAGLAAGLTGAGGMIGAPRLTTPAAPVSPIATAAVASAVAGAGAGAGAGSNQAQGAAILAQMLAEQRQTNALLAQVARGSGSSGGGSSTSPAGTASGAAAGIILNGAQFNGVTDLAALYRALNALGGIAAENSLRGANAGLAI